MSNDEVNNILINTDNVIVPYIYMRKLMRVVYYWIDFCQTAYRYKQ